MNFGGLRALKEVNLEVRKGEIFGLIGPNGAGKTTFFNIVAGSLKPTSGEIKFNDKNIQGLKPYQICNMGISRTFQLTKPFKDFTVLENVMVGAFQKTKNLKLAQKKSLEVLEFTGLLGEKDIISSNLTLCSQRRIEIARSLATEPILLLLDETMAGLTSNEAIEIVSLIKEIRVRGIAIFLIEHVMKLVMELSDRVAVLNFGEKIAEGFPQEITNNKSVIKAYLGDEYV